MKTAQYTVYYLNDRQESFSTFGFTNATILAKAHAIQRGWDSRIKYIVDEKGMQITNPQVTIEYKLEN